MRVRVFQRKGKRGSRWWLDYHWAGRRWRYPVADTRKTADEIAARIQVQAGDGSFKGPQSVGDTNQETPPRTYAELCEKWLQGRDITPDTEQDYRSMNQTLVKHFGARTHYAGISKLQCLRFVESRWKRGKSVVRGNRYLFALRSQFLYAKRRGWIDYNPTDGIRKKDERECRRERALTGDGELAAVLAECPAWLHPIAMAAAYTGPRRSDLLGTKDGRKKPLMWTQVDLEQRVVRFLNTKERRPREVPLADELVAVLRDLPSRFQGREVFLDGRGKPVKPERASRAVKAAAIRAGIKDAAKLRFHDLRHTCGSLLGKSHVDPVEIRDILGHHSVTMTERYLHTRREQLRKAVSKLSGTIQAQIGTTDEESESA